MISVDSLSLTTVKLEQYCAGNLLGTASGFFYRKDSRLFLVSNWHVFSGRHPTTRQPLHSACAVPDSQKMFWHVINDNSQIEAFGLDSRLLNDNDVAEWWEHPEQGSKVDVGVVECVGNWHAKIQSAELAAGNVLPIKIGMDVFVLGYPLGLTKQGLFPVWKRGSIASEPMLDTEDQPVILVDAGTRDGMSGSPVVLVSRSSGFGRDAAGNMKVGDRARLLGVYSGRYGAEKLSEVQLGLCWKTPLIDEIIVGKKPADVDF